MNGFGACGKSKAHSSGAEARQACQRIMLELKLRPPVPQTFFCKLADVKYGIRHFPGVRRLY